MTFCLDPPSIDALLACPLRYRIPKTETRKDRPNRHVLRGLRPQDLIRVLSIKGLHPDPREACYYIANPSSSAHDTLPFLDCPRHAPADYCLLPLAEGRLYLANCPAAPNTPLFIDVRGIFMPATEEDALQYWKPLQSGLNTFYRGKLRPPRFHLG
ncbi:MAG: hypothetical protein HC945_01705 [Nitrosarchaeum sp.]|nr:hypothetical protein [Nitrosarchaeum sp.]